MTHVQLWTFLFANSRIGYLVHFAFFYEIYVYARDLLGSRFDTDWFLMEPKCLNATNRKLFSIQYNMLLTTIKW